MKGLSINGVWARLARSRMASRVAESLGGKEAQEALLAQAGYPGQPAGLAARLMVEVGRALPLALDAASLRGFGAVLAGEEVMAAARAEALSRYPGGKGPPLPASQVRLSPEEEAALWPWTSGQRAARLARAFALTRDADLAQAAVQSLAEFCAHNPPLMGPGWADEQATAIRVVNWLWCLRFLDDPATLPPETLLELLVQMQVAGQLLAEALRSASGPAPLQAGPAAALLHLGRGLGFLPEAAAWLDLGAARLGPALRSWSRSSASSPSPPPPSSAPSPPMPPPAMATTWAPVMLEWGGLGLWLAQKAGLAPEGVVAGLRTLGPLVRAMAPPWGAGLAWGWSPAVSVLGLDQGRVDPATGAANLAAVLLTDPDLRAGRVMDERLYWLYGRPAAEQLRQLAGGAPPPAQELPPAGLAVLCGRTAGRRVSLWLRTAPHKADPPAGSVWSAQALALGLCLDGRGLLVPPGPAGSGPLARHLSSRAAFNAVRLDGAEPRGGAVVLEALEEDERSAFVAASYDGYAHLPDPVRLRRRLFLDKTAGLVQVVDQVQAEGEHDCEVLFHLPAGCQVEQAGGGALWLGGPWGRVLMRPEPKAAVEVVIGRSKPPLGWLAGQGGVGGGGGEVQAAPVVRLYARVVGSARLTTSLVLAPGPAP